MLYSEENVKANIRNRQGQRVFFLGNGDQLTPSARDWLQRERIEILPASQAVITQYQLENGAVLQEKPEHYTHLRGNILVPKTHPVIAFRGAVDTLQAQLLLAQAAAPESIRPQVGELLALARMLIRWDVMQEPAQLHGLFGITDEQLRNRSHFPQEHYGIPHFMPEYTDGPAMLQLNAARCAARSLELAAARAFGTERPDLIQILNRMSSAIYLLMLQLKKDL